VPFLCWIAFRERPRFLTLAGLGIGLFGCAVLVDGWHLRFGDWLTLGASVLFAVQMLVLDRVGKRMNPAHLSTGFLVITGTLGLLGAVLAAAFGDGVCAWASWVGEMLAVPKLAWSVVALAALPTAIAFHWMNSYQPQVSATRAGIIYLLESVFAAAFSASLGYEEVTYPLVFGGLMILTGNAIAAIPSHPVVPPEGIPASPPERP